MLDEMATAPGVRLTAVGFLCSVVSLAVLIPFPPRAGADMSQAPHSITPPAPPRCLEFRRGPYLGMLRDGTIGLGFQLVERPRRIRRVVVDGRSFRVRRVGASRDHVYLARWLQPRGLNAQLAAGHRYKVRIDVALPPHRTLCLLSVPYGHDNPHSGHTCSAGCSDSYVAPLLLHRTLRGFRPASRGSLVPDVGMAGVRLGMTHAEVEARLGRPLSVERMGSEEFCCDYKFARAISTTFFDDRALAQISTSGRAERTADGIGVGSSLRRVRQVFPHTRCDRVSKSASRCRLTRCRAFRTRSSPLRGLARDTEATVVRGVVTEVEIAGYFATACQSLNG